MAVFLWYVVRFVVSLCFCGSSCFGGMFVFCGMCVFVVCCGSFCLYVCVCLSKAVLTWLFYGKARVTHCWTQGVTQKKEGGIADASEPDRVAVVAGIFQVNFL